MTVAAPTKTWPVMEMFGPTIQGEGPQAGLPVQFIRFGYCDYRCSWCDTMESVEPASVRANATGMTASKIVHDLLEHPEWVILSGGNPALLDLSELVERMKAAGFRIAIETQGSKWRPWLQELDQIVISPKPPSSGMVTPRHDAETIEFMAQAEDAWSRGVEVAVKIVIFDQDDLEWARDFLCCYPWTQKFLSVGTPTEVEVEAAASINELAMSSDLGPDDLLKLEICNRYCWLIEQCKGDPSLSDVRISPQLHVLAWGPAKGV